MRDTPPWTPEDIRQLKQLRHEGHTYQTIARALHRSIKAVECKARYLRMGRKRPNRPPPPNFIPRAGKVTLPPLPSLMAQE